MQDSENIKTVLMLGRPGSGKGTQSRLLGEYTGWEVFSSGGKFREMTMQDTFVGKKVAETIDNGLLMPPWFAIYVFQHAILNAPHEKGFIFEGSARTLDEAEHFHSVMTWLERPYRAVHLSVDQEEVMKRLLARGEGREDDTEESVRNRFNEYQRHTAPAIEFIKSTGHLIEIDGMREPQEVHKEVVEALGLE